MTSGSLPLPSAQNGLRFSPTFLRSLGRVMLGLAIFHLVLQLIYWLPMELGRTDTGRDTTVYFNAALRLKNGLDVYQRWTDFGVEKTPGGFFYSPVFLLITRPLAELPYLPFVRVWMVLIFAASWVYCFCLSRLAMGRWDWKSALIFGLFLDGIFQGHIALSIGQFEPFMWMMFGLALTTKNRAGLLALAALVKIHPVWSLALALGQGGKNAWKNAAIFALPVLAASLWFVGLHNWAMWWPATQPIASQGTFHPGNWSLSFQGLRLLSKFGLLVPVGNLPTWAKAYLSLCGVGAPLGTMFLARKCSPELRLSLVACASILFAPLCWAMYLPLLLLPIAVLIGERRTAAAVAKDL